MTEAAAREQWHTKKITDWLFAVLRFAVTLDPADKAVSLAIAEEIDRLGTVPPRTGFAFFSCATTELCNAIANKDDPQRAALLRRHLSRIDDRRLRRALEAAIDCEQRAERKVKKRHDSNLWKGLTGTRY